MSQITKGAIIYAVLYGSLTMKQLLLIVTFFAFSVQTFNKIIVVVAYYTNTASFAKNCENKAKPMLHCNGHCQLMKKLKQEENKDKQNPERNIKTKNEVLYFTKLTSFTFAFNNAPILPFSKFNNKQPIDFPTSIFHPPCS